MRTYELVHGFWFNGESFQSHTMYIVDDTFASSRPDRVDSIVDLHEGYVVPPFADAHNHNIEFTNSRRTADVLAKYLREGVFYDQNPDNLPRARAGLAGMINTPTGVDATFSNGGLTGTDGHPTGLFRRNLGLGIFGPADGDGGFLWYIDSVADLNHKWPAILAQKPDFIKVYLLYSEEFAKRRNDTTYFNWKGIDPTLVPEIVRRAHRQHLRVVAHIETAADFHNAVYAGVDEIGHTPGFRGDETGKLYDATRYRIADSDAAEAARRGTVVITTLALGATRFARDGTDSVMRRAFDDLNATNLRLLRRNKVRLAIGSDNYRTTSVPEALYLHSLGVLTDADLLAVWTDATPRAIFPARKIGRLMPGYEASFLVLDGDPLVDFTNVTRIALRVKQGNILSPEDQRN